MSGARAIDGSRVEVWSAAIHPPGTKRRTTSATTTLCRRRRAWLEPWHRKKRIDFTCSRRLKIYVCHVAVVVHPEGVVSPHGSKLYVPGALAALLPNTKGVWSPSVISTLGPRIRGYPTFTLEFRSCWWLVSFKVEDSTTVFPGCCFEFQDALWFCLWRLDCGCRGWCTRLCLGCILVAHSACYMRVESKLSLLLKEPGMELLPLSLCHRYRVISATMIQVCSSCSFHYFVKSWGDIRWVCEPRRQTMIDFQLPSLQTNSTKEYLHVQATRLGGYDDGFWGSSPYNNGYNLPIQVHSKNRHDQSLPVALRTPRGQGDLGCLPWRHLGRVRRFLGLDKTCWCHR